MSSNNSVTPIYDFLSDYINKNKIRLHMPGHKGVHFSKALNDICKYDITEIEGADVLFDCDGIISKSENITASFVGCVDTLFSTQGSTLSIYTMLAGAFKEGDVVLAARNSHIAFINGCTLLGLNPKWILPKKYSNIGYNRKLTKDEVECGIKKYNPKGVYITSPDYYGNISDVKGISEVCSKYNIPLLVDNAHGAHLFITDKNMHPINQGAALTADSPHKTLPVLTSGSYVHISQLAKNFNITKNLLKSKMSLFGSTSPSYVTLLSLDLANEYYSTFAKNDFLSLEKKIKQLNTVVLNTNDNKDCTKLTINCNKLGYTSNEIMDILRKNNVEVEYYNDVYIVLMFSPFNKEEDFFLVLDIFKNLVHKNVIESAKEEYILPKQIYTPREAFSKQCENVAIDDTLGRVAAENKITCPPGIPIVLMGEIINNNSLKFLKSTSILSLNVLK